MKTNDFLYTLPERLIAQHPCESRDHSRMMIVNRADGTIQCRHFYEIDQFLDAGDALVINNSRVIPARLRGRKSTGAVIEMLLLSKEDGPFQWEVLLKPAKRVRIGTRIFFDTRSWCDVIDRRSDKKWVVRFHTEEEFDHFLDRFGTAPLPPYIKRKDGASDDTLDHERYQTVYAQKDGSVAAPTAGLHFSESVLASLNGKGIDIVPVTLHVGYGTFLPIETDLIEDHRMEEEYFEISEDAAGKINRARRIIATGTTSVRVLESSTGEDGQTRALTGQTNLFIYPGYRFKKVDCLLTNFHLPRSSLFLLVCAFAGKELMERAYGIAIREEFRFYSYGDCMLIL